MKSQEIINKKISNFSEKCISAVNELVKQLGITPIQWQYFQGKTDEYYKGKIYCLYIFIYDDECQIQAKYIDLIYESYDYANESDQINKFMKDLKEILEYSE